MAVSAKLKTVKAAKLLSKGQVLAQQTSTLAGIAASPYSPKGVARLQRFKQRKAPFLLLADSLSTALKQATYLTPSLRKLAKQSWPGSITLLFPAKKALAMPCYQRGLIAIRVDADRETRRLANAVGGLLLSSSLNRRGKPVQTPNKALQYRWKRHLSGLLVSKQQALGQASSIFRVSRQGAKQLR